MKLIINSSPLIPKAISKSITKVLVFPLVFPSEGAFLSFYEKIVVDNNICHHLKIMRWFLCLSLILMVSCHEPSISVAIQPRAN